MSDLTDFSESAFVKALFGEDALGVVVRAHIHIEARLVEFLELMVTDTKYLEHLDLDFSRRVRLAVALGLKAEHAPALLALGTLRNAFAHRLDTELTQDRVKNLYQALSSSDKEIVQHAYERTKSQMQQPGPSFNELQPKDQFVLIAVALRAMLLLAIQEVRDRQPKA